MSTVIPLLSYPFKLISWFVECGSLGTHTEGFLVPRVLSISVDFETYCMHNRLSLQLTVFLSTTLYCTFPFSRHCIDALHQWLVGFLLLLCLLSLPDLWKNSLLILCCDWNIMYLTFPVLLFLQTVKNQIFAFFEIVPT